MKIYKLLLYIIFFSFVVNSLAQPYKEIIKEDTSIWYFAHRQLAGWFVDTIFAKEKNNNWIEINYKGELYSNKLTYAGSIKTDSENIKLWYKSPSRQDSILIYNLAIERGDTFYFDNLNITGHVDSIYFINERKVIQFDIMGEWGEKIKFIEGVGPNISLIYAWNGSGILTPFVICKYNNKELIYSVNNQKYFEGCSLKLSIINNFKNEDIIIKPNPFNNYIQIKGNSLNKEYRIKIYNVIGMLEINKTINANYTVNTSYLAKGIYFIHLFNNEDYIKLKAIKK